MALVQPAPAQEAAINAQLEAGRALAETLTGRVNALPQGGLDLSGVPQLQSGIDFSGLPQLQTGLDTSNLPILPGIDDFSADAQRVEDATFQRIQNNLDPVFAQQTERLGGQIAQQGLDPMGQAVTNPLRTGLADAVFQSQQQALENAALQSVAAGRQEQSRLFGLASSARNQALGEQLAGVQLGNQARSQALAELLSNVQVGNQARQQAFSEAAFQRALPFNELAAAISGTQIGTPGIPQIQTTPVDVIGPAQLAQNNSLAAFNAQNQGRTGALTGFTNLAGAGLLAAGQAGGFGALFSSKAMKHEVGPAETILDGVDRLDVKAWRYREDSPAYDGKLHIGPYAEDWHEIFGLGDGTTISIIDGIGVCLQAIKDLSRKVRVLEHGIVS